jgi:hypothetical protein
MEFQGINTVVVVKYFLSQIINTVLAVEFALG